MNNKTFPASKLDMELEVCKLFIQASLDCVLNFRFCDTTNIFSCVFLNYYCLSFTDITEIELGRY